MIIIFREIVGGRGGRVGGGDVVGSIPLVLCYQMEFEKPSISLLPE